MNDYICHTACRSPTEGGELEMTKKEKWKD